MTLLLKKGVQFQWSPQCQDAFQLLKDALINAPIFRIPDFSKTFTIKADTTDIGMGAVISE